MLALPTSNQEPPLFLPARALVFRFLVLVGGNGVIITTIQVLKSPTIPQRNPCKSCNNFNNFCRSSKPSLLSSIENTMSSSVRSSLLFASPVRMEEDVLVMDEISVDSIPVSRPKLLISSDSWSSSSGYNLHKTEICRAWEDFSCCRYLAKCQLAHGKEELCPSRSTNKNKYEVQTLISNGRIESSTVHKSRFFRPSADVEAVTVSPEAESTTISDSTTESNSSFSSPGRKEWLPYDDGIETVLPFSFPEWAEILIERRGNIAEFMRIVLYGSNKKRTRLPLFCDLCSS